MSRSRFDPTSDRAIKGLAFQNDLQDKLSDKFNSVMNTREWLLCMDPFLKAIQLNTLEHTWGDIILLDKRLDHPIFIECVSVNWERSIFPEHKINKFEGKNKFYCFGWENKEYRFIHSMTWNAYARKLPKFDCYRRFKRSNIESINKQDPSIDAFCKKLLSKKTCNTK